MSKAKFVTVRYGDKIVKEEISNLSDKFLDYAVLSSNVYCTADTDPLMIPLPSWKLFDQEKLPQIPTPTLKSQSFINGLKYQVYYKESDEKILAAIAFKGTNFSFKNDWVCNLRWLTMNPVLKHVFKLLLWDYYHQVQVLTPKIIDSLKTTFSNKQIEFIATGHSLGGGLAQQAAYSTNAIKKVIVFDPSPVTGYADVRKELRLINQQGIDTSRVYQKGEVLAYLRDFIRKYFLPLSVENPSIKEYQFSFLRGTSIQRHDIRKFALHLVELSENQLA